ncbi:hypothetical protein LCGC14_2465080 [marine sediment metagenome]|uniref:Uncharacterized protein n=1 Tax=marine sediment metagenome TaxID=412755 RepID=A0A0F9BCM9_9ZZZZ
MVNYLILGQGIKTAKTTKAEPLSATSIPCKEVIIISDSGGSAVNTNDSATTIRIGDSSIDNNGPGIRIGAEIRFGGVITGGIDPSKIYCISNVASQKLMWWAIG